MSARPVLRRPRVLAAAAATIALGASLAVAAPAQATGGLPALQPRTYAASLVSPVGPITRGVVTPFQIKVVNTSTTISALDRIRVTIPAGFAVTLTGAAVSAPRGGWTESLSGSTLTVATNKPLTSALRKGEALTFTFSAKATPTSCAAMPSTWPLQVDGIFLVYTSPGATPLTTNVSSVADTFVVDPAPDVNGVLPGNQVNKGESFAVTGAFKCNGSSAPAGAAGTVSLVQTGAGAPAPGTTLTSAPATVATSDTTATVSGTFDKVANGAGVVVKWNSAVSGSLMFDVLGASDTSNGHPGTELTVPGATTTLTHGANGNVSLAVTACDPAEATCSHGTQVELTGDFKDLYTNDDPAQLTWICADCEHRDAHSQWSWIDWHTNYDCDPLFSCFQSNSAPFGLRNVEEDFQDNPVYVSMKLSAAHGGGYTPFAKAGRCVSLPADALSWWNLHSYLEIRDYYLHHTGSIEDAAAKTAGFCVDVNAITRDADTGALSIPVLFVEDPRLRP